ncbi:MAG TPA: tetratricopeptide repeat protein [Blastocatellia bacterium]|nr:tetratricopeptide repeat protein [Blastocatellia bacterium]
MLILFLLLSGPAQAQRAGKPPAKTGSVKVITGKPGSVVFINNVRHGVTGESGELDLPRAWVGSYPVRVRTAGYTDWNGRVVVTAGTARVLKVTQQPTSDQALVHFQKAEDLRDKGKNEDAVKEYKQALALRPNFPEARIGLTRILITQQVFDEAERQLQAAMKGSPRSGAEAQTVLGNLRRNQGLYDESIEAYRKALRLARGVSPEAHIGLALALEEIGETDAAIKEFYAGIAQDMDTEPILYYLLGSALEKARRNKEAIEAYRHYLRLDPEGQYASAVESIIEQLKENPDGNNQ